MKANLKHMYAVRRNGYGPFRRFLFSASLALCASLIFTGCAPTVSGPGEMSRSEETAAQSVPAPDAAGVLKVHFIDVGQGDSILIQSGAENMLVDAGTNESGPTVTAYLQSLGVTKLSYLIGTHPHEDRSSYVQLEYLGSYASAGASPTKCPTHQLTSQPPPSKYPCFF